MRTKTLLLTAAVALGGVAPSMAQVYSQNVVGYVTLTLSNRYTMISNPLNGPGGSNTLIQILPSAPPGAGIYKYNPTTSTFENKVTFAAGNWLGGTGNGTVLAPGQGAFIQTDTATPAAPVTITFVGEVLDGNTSLSIPAGFSIASSVLPVAAPLGKAADPEPAAGGAVTSLRFPGAAGDRVLFWDKAGQTYRSALTFISDAAGWLGSGAPAGGVGPTPAVGESFFISALGARTWTRTYKINP
jgi:hypothetical protein